MLRCLLKDGNLKVGDELLAINGEPVVGLSHVEVKNLIPCQSSIDLAFTFKYDVIVFNHQIPYFRWHECLKFAQERSNSPQLRRRNKIPFVKVQSKTTLWNLTPLFCHHHEIPAYIRP